MPTSRPAADSLADHLKDRTSEQHRRAEQRPLQRAMAGGTIGRSMHARWAVAMHAVHAALEEGLGQLPAARPDLTGAADLVAGHRRHVDNLQSDIAAARAAGHLDADADADAEAIGPATAAVVADLHRRAEHEPVSLLGSLYVLEGSMNGNRFIAARLAQAWGDGAGMAYLDPDGAEQRPRWLRWRAGLDALPLTDADRAAIAGAAGAMFDAVSALSDEVAGDEDA